MGGSCDEKETAVCGTTAQNTYNQCTACKVGWAPLSAESKPKCNEITDIRATESSAKQGERHVLGPACAVPT